MNQSELIKAVAEKTGLKNKDVEEAVKCLSDVVAGELAKGLPVTLHKLGTFKIAVRKARSGFNPSTREPIAIPEKNKVVFKATTALDSQVNE